MGCLTADGASGELSHTLCNTKAAFFVGDTTRHSGPPKGPSVAPAPPPVQDHVKRGVGLDFAMLDSTFLLSQVFPTLFMGMIVQLTESVTTYMASSAIFGSVAVYLVGHVVFEQKDLRNWEEAKGEYKYVCCLLGHCSFNIRSHAVTVAMETQSSHRYLFFIYIRVLYGCFSEFQNVTLTHLPPAVFNVTPPPPPLPSVPHTPEIVHFKDPKTIGRAQNNMVIIHSASGRL